MKVLTDKTRQFIGDTLLAVNGTTMSISALAAATGYTRALLTRWANNEFMLWHFTKHIDDTIIQRNASRVYGATDSRFFAHAREYCRRVIEIRTSAASNPYNPLNALEEERIRDQNSRR